MKLFFPQNYVNLTEKSQFLPIYKKIRQIDGIFTNEQRILVSRNNYSLSNQTIPSKVGETLQWLQIHEKNFCCPYSKVFEQTHKSEKKIGISKLSRNSKSKYFRVLSKHLLDQHHHPGSHSKQP